MNEFYQPARRPGQGKRGSAEEDPGVAGMKKGWERKANTESWNSSKELCWQSKPLAEVCNIEYGTRVVQKRDGGKGFPVYGGGGITFEMDVFNREDRLVVARFGISEECTRFVLGRFFLNDSGLTVSPKNGVMLQKFLDYQLLSLNDNIYALGRGTAQKNLDVPVFRTLNLVFPVALTEQRRIVAILDTAFAELAAARAAAERNLRNARALFESRLNEVFTRKGEGWVETRLDELYRIGSSKRVLKSQWKPEGIPFYRGREVTRLACFGFVDNELFISEEHFAELSKVYGVPRVDDIVITAIGTIGNAYIVRHSDRFYFKDASVLWMQRIADVSSVFIKYWLKSSLFFEQLDRGNGATVDTLTIKKLQSVELHLPPKGEQLEIVAHLDALAAETRKLENLYERKLAALDELKKSILRQAFNGEL